MKNRYVLFADLVLIPVAAFAAFIARFDWGFLEDRREFVPYVIAALIVKPTVFFMLGMYRRYWRYTSIDDLATMGLAVTASSIAMSLVVAAYQGSYLAGFSRVVIFNDWLLTMATAGGVRLAIRVVKDASAAGPTASRLGRSRVLVVGAGSAGTMVVREMRRNPQLGMEPIGFLDDDIDKVGRYLGGFRVFAQTGDLPKIVLARRVNHVVIAMPTAPGPAVRAIVDNCRAVGVSSQIIPGVFELLGGRASINRLRTVEIEDLLRRAPVMGDAQGSQVVTDRVVLITGAGGSIGYELARQVANSAPSNLVLLGHGENSLFEAEAKLRAAFPMVKLTTVIADTRDERRMGMVFDRFQPSVVFHAAAHKHVPLMEDNPEEAVTNNVVATRNLIRQAMRTATERFVLISTDKAVAPTSIMGATKRIAEAVVRQAARQSGRAFVVVRFGNVLGSRGSVVQTFKSQIEQGGPITVTHPDMTRFFMTIPEAVHLVLRASGEGKGGELFVLNMGAPIRIVDLARDLVTLSGLDEDEMPIAFTGMRPGEKLHERLYDADAETRPTSHPDVLEIVGHDPCALLDLGEVIARLEAAVYRGDKDEIAALLAQTIPGFGPSRHENPGHPLTVDGQRRRELI